jgi:hypothetical protein
MYLRNVFGATIIVSMVAFAQNTEDTAFQVRYAANLDKGESYIDIINTGANGAPLLGPGFGGPAGNICVNAYAFSSDEQLVACCSCLLTPNQVGSLGVNKDLLFKTLTGAPGVTSVTVKLLATLAGDGTGTSCTNSAALAGTTKFKITNGMAAFGTTLHQTPVAGTFATTETQFTPATLSQGDAGGNNELASITGRCASIIGNGSTFGICNSCKPGALGGAPLGK